MIQLHVIAANKKDAEHLVRFLIEKKLVLSAHINPITEYGEITSEPVTKWQLSGRTKALLYHDIQQALLSHPLGKDLPVYAIPIVYMDERQNDLLRNNTQST
jgi:hypothetical protein